MKVVQKLSQFQVEMDVLPGKKFNAFTRGGDWNGWAEPLFTFEEGKRIVDAFNATKGTKAKYDPKRDVFVFEDSDGEIEEFGGGDYGGRKLYPVGTSIWCWSESET